MEKQELELALKTHGEQITQKQADLQKAIEDKLTAKADGLKKSIDEMETKYAEMQKQLNEQNIAIQEAKTFKPSDDSVPTLEKALHNLFATKEFKEAKAAGFPKGKQSFEIKADTTNITGTVNMTAQNLSVKFNPERALAFIPYLNPGFVGSDKNRVLWMEGAFTSNVGYVGEGVRNSTGDAGTANEKTRGMCKISAWIYLSDELLNDAEYIASAFRMKMQEKALLFMDGECYDGDGNDSTQPNHIYGIQGQATEYDITTTGSASTVERANIGDLVEDMILQAELSEQRGLNKIWIHPKDFNRFKKAKDANGQYLFVKDVNGNYTINGLDVVKTTKVTANTMLVADSMKIQLWWKRNVEVKFGQESTNLTDDKYTAVLFLRNQIVVEGPDKTALIYCSDIDTAIDTLDK